MHHPHAPSITIEPRRVIPLALRTGDRVLCTRGCVWLTWDGEPEDIVLDAGASLVVARPGRLLAQALVRAACVEVAPTFARTREAPAIQATQQRSSRSWWPA